MPGNQLLVTCYGQTPCTCVPIRVCCACLMPAPSADSGSPLKYEEPNSPQTILNSQAPLSAFKIIQNTNNASKTRNDFGVLQTTKSARTCMNQKNLPKLQNPIVIIDLQNELRKTVTKSNSSKINCEKPKNQKAENKPQIQKKSKNGQSKIASIVLSSSDGDSKRLNPMESDSAAETQNIKSPRVIDDLPLPKRIVPKLPLRELTKCSIMTDKVNFEKQSENLKSAHTERTSKPVNNLIPREYVNLGPGAQNESKPCRSRHYSPYQELRLRWKIQKERESKSTGSKVTLFNNLSQRALNHIQGTPEKIDSQRSPTGHSKSAAKIKIK